MKDNLFPRRLPLLRWLASFLVDVVVVVVSFEVAASVSRAAAFSTATAFTKKQYPLVHRSTVDSSRTRLNNNIFRKINNAVESSLATAQSVLFYGRMPGGLPKGMHSVPTQFIAAVGDPTASSAPSGAEKWGIWRVDPGPRGVYIRDFQSNPSLGSKNQRMPSGWIFDPNEFWIEEYGRVMEKPDVPLTPGRYIVTGGRDATALLTVDKPNARGEQGWSLNNGNLGVTLYDVTHLPCRSARYIPKGGKDRSPADANLKDFPVVPGGIMPKVEGCDKLDYAVLFVLAVDD